MKDVLYVVLMVTIISSSSSVDHKEINRTKHVKIGCFEDGNYFKELLINDRDPSSHAHTPGIRVDWHNYGDYTRGLVRRCVEKAIEKAKSSEVKHAYRFISLRHYGECWGAEEPMYKIHHLKRKPGCQQGQYEPCQDGSEQECNAPDNIQYIYHVLWDKDYKEDTRSGSSTRLNEESCYRETITVCSSDITSATETKRAQHTVH